MVEFKESKFYKLLQDFFINNNKETFLQMLAEFYNRTENIIEKNVNQDELIKELRELYLEFNEKGIDENIVREKVDYFVENNGKIKDILAKLVINTNKIEDNTEKLNENTNSIENINSQMDKSVKKSYYGGKSNLSPYYNKGCAFAWVDDDGSKGFLTTLKPLLDSRGMKCSLGIITDRVGTDTYLSKSELLELQENGYEIVSHSASHSSDIFKDNLAISESIIKKDLKKSQDWLFKNGFTGYDTLIFPWGNFGSYSAKYKSAARKYFKYACNAHGSYNKTPVDNMYMDRYFIMKTMNIETIKAKIDETIAKNGLLIFGSHSYSSSEFDKVFFETVIDYVISKGYEITTLEKALEKKGNAISIGEYNDFYGNFFISNDGTNNLAYEIISTNTVYNETTPLSEFPINKIVRFVSTNNSFGVGGIMEVFRSSAKYYSYRTFTPYNDNVIYMSKHDDVTSHTWLSWSKINEDNLIVKQGLYDGTMDDPISSYLKYKETIIQIRDTLDTLTNVGGTMRVYRGDEHYSYATFMNVIGDFYIRRWNDINSTWSTWKKCTP